MRAGIVESLPHVKGVLNFHGAMSEKPRTYFCDPPAGVPQSNLIEEAHTVEIRDARPIASSFSLDREGMAFVEHRSTFCDFDDDDKQDGLRQRYYPEIERLVGEFTGSDRVFVFDHAIRRRRPNDNPFLPVGYLRRPLLYAHCDFTSEGAAQFVRDRMGAEADALLRKRYAIIHFWRPIRGPLRDAPLAMCDAGTVATEDLVPWERINPGRTIEMYRLAFNPLQQWFYMSGMLEHEAILFKGYDSRPDSHARFVPHSAFEDPTAGAGVIPRESVELRMLVFHED